MMTMKGVFDLSSLNLLSEVLVDLKILKKKGLLAVVENKLSIPKKKRSTIMKRKRFGEDGNDRVLKRHRTGAAHQLGSSSSSSPQLGHFQEMNKMIRGLIGGGDIPLWSFQRKSPLRFSLIRLNVTGLSARATMVS